MDKNETLLLTTSRIREMLGGISRVTFLNWRKKWAAAGTPFPEPLHELSTTSRPVYRYHDVVKFFESVGIISDSDNQ
ncbi:helix-turn-helix domain-containing protein [Escherichia coli]|nr:helix-turn-helix domain-containing protein [Escherichia coli]